VPAGNIMIPAMVLRGVDAIAALRPLGSSRNDALRLLPQLDPGDVVSARIEAKLPDGSFKALVAGQALNLALPAYVAAGDTLELTFIAREPRLTFAMQDAPPEVAPPLLSAAGRLVAATMLAPGETAMPAAASAAAPLLATAPQGGAALAHTLAQSGLFYEAHQAQWLSGKRELAQILQEPQARLARAAAQPGTAAVAPGLSAAVPARASEQSIHPLAVPLVQQQLAALDTARVMLQVEVWPGQWMHWEIDEHERGAPREPDAPQSWSTQLQLDLPQLGEVRAALALAADGLRVKLTAASGDSADLLQGERASLAAALAQAGAPAASIAVTVHACS